MKEATPGPWYLLLIGLSHLSAYLQGQLDQLAVIRFCQWAAQECPTEVQTICLLRIQMSPNDKLDTSHLPQSSCAIRSPEQFLWHWFSKPCHFKTEVWAYPLPLSLELSFTTLTYKNSTHFISFYFIQSPSLVEWHELQYWHFKSNCEKWIGKKYICKNNRS